MDTVPNIITLKDMIYLKELFNKNYNIFKEVENILPDINDNDVKELIERVKNLHEDYMYFIISSLKKENYFEEDTNE